MSRRISFALAACLAVGVGALAVAQIEGNERGVPPIDSSANYEVGGVQVDVSAHDAVSARSAGWRIAQRKAWKQLWGGAHGAPPESAPAIGDGALDSMVAGIAVEDEQIGTHRYIARLGVLFDRVRAGDLLGIGGGGPRSQPMLVIPVLYSGGTVQSFERRTEWQKAWARFRSGGSPIDYVRPAGTGMDPLLLNAAQAGRPGRSWWRMLLAQYGAADVVIPVVELERRYPGGPVLARFKAIHGPDGDVVARFDLMAESSAALPRVLDDGVRRIDEAYSIALRRGDLRSDTSLIAEPAPVDALPEEAATEETGTNATPLGVATQALTLQVPTPDDGSRAAMEGLLRGILGVRSVQTTSLALGGDSLMRVEFAGDPAALRAALQARGYTLDDRLRLGRAAP